VLNEDSSEQSMTFTHYTQNQGCPSEHSNTPWSLCGNWTPGHHICLGSTVTARDAWSTRRFNVQQPNAGQTVTIRMPGSSQLSRDGCQRIDAARQRCWRVLLTLRQRLGLGPYSGFGGVAEA
jgi:hypothetical protein